MTVATTRTKAEQALLQQFEAVEQALPGTGWVKTLRREAIGVFGAIGLPHRRMEQWKYTDLRERVRDVPALALEPVAKPSKAVVETALGPLARLEAHRLVFVDGAFAPDLSDIDGLTDTIEVKPLGALLAKAPDWLQTKFKPERVGEGDAVAALNLAFMTDGALLKVKAGADPGRPVLLVFACSTDRPSAVTQRNIVSVEAGARLILVEAHVALGSGTAKSNSNFATDVDVADKANLAHVQYTGGSGVTHLSGWRVRIGKEANYRGFQLTAGAKLARNNVFATFTGERAKFDLSGVFLGRGGDHIDTMLVLDHTTVGCESRELFKGVLDGHARGIFQGKVIVEPVAQKTDGKQMAQALMLSEEAEFDSKPELEIYADDVACGHGSTSSEIDPDMLFYLRSRGIPEDEARTMLIESFVGEAIEKIENESLREALSEIALGWLRAA